MAGLTRTRRAIVPDIGLPEIIIIALVIMLLFGAQRLPKLGRSLGQSISGFKKGLHEELPHDESEAEVEAKPEPAVVVAAEAKELPEAAPVAVDEAKEPADAAPVVADEATEPAESSQPA